ncbi:hypothetical protein OSB04_023815 [Centaurea solstitialis]|uniref:Zinc finger, CCHC-type n=1 Tax=Centaurea solstitialis TaxID=347529 RepID=A0AA38SKL0_9ASTR|nr:hypothetical protein OSB04_023815 [Centaurea solstitialis]
MIRSMKDVLKSKFDMKDTGLTDVILGIKITRTQNGLVLSQTHYVDRLLRTIIKETLSTFIQNRGNNVAQVEYSRIIGNPIYLMIIRVLIRRYTSNPSVEHCKNITRLLRYPIVIEGYSDANWISDIKDSRSTSGYVFTLEGATISWKSSKQTIIARSTMENEFITLDKNGEEAKWLCQFVKDIPKWPKPVTAICIPMYNGKSRCNAPFPKRKIAKKTNQRVGRPVPATSGHAMSWELSQGSEQQDGVSTLVEFVGESVNQDTNGEVKTKFVSMETSQLVSSCSLRSRRTRDQHSLDSCGRGCILHQLLFREREDSLRVEPAKDDGNVWWDLRVQSWMEKQVNAMSSEKFEELFWEQLML